MTKKKSSDDLSDKIQVALDRAVRKLIEETKLRGEYLIRGIKMASLSGFMPKTYED